jgi:hypothetical protein
MPLGSKWESSGYVLAVPSTTSIRDLEAEPPPYGGHGRRPKPPFQGVRAWCEALPAEAWTRLTVREGEQGPLEVEIVARRVESKVTPIGLIPVTVRLRPELAVALKRASLERQLAGEELFTQQEIVEQALEPWLREEGYLD